MDSACLTCGHDRDQHPPNHFAMFGWHCKVVGCSCGQFERTQGGDAHDLPDRPTGNGGAGTDVTGPATASTPTGAVVGPPDPDWDDERTPPLLERVPWRIGVLDKDLLEDPDAIVDNASWIAGWYVHDCDELLRLVGSLGESAGPPDLAHAIQAATDALEAAYDWDGYNIQQVARIALLGAWDKLFDLFLAEVAALDLDVAQEEDRR